MTRHQHNRQFFDQLTAESCYWAGFVAADGNIYPPNGGIIFGLAERDKEHLVGFKTAIGSTSPVTCRDTSNGYRSAWLQIYGARECHTALEKHFNITASKSLTLQPPPLEQEEHIRAFIRGYMDGDGSINWGNRSKCKGQWQCSFLGTQQMLEWIKLQLQKYVPQTGKRSVAPDRNVFQVVFSGEQIKYILDWLYANSTSETRLVRKYNKYLEVCEFYKTPRQYGSKYRGVSFSKKDKVWRSELKYNKQIFRLGSFRHEKDAAIAYNTKARELGLLSRCYEIY